MLVVLWATTSAHAGCGGAISTLRRDWTRVSVPVSTGGSDLGPVASALAEHGRIEDELKAARRGSGRDTLPAALDHVEAWLAANPGTLGADLVRTDLAAVRSECLP
jgi:hypothetical protein